MRTRASHYAVIFAAWLFVLSCERDPRAYSGESAQTARTSQLVIKSVEIVELNASPAKGTSKKLEEWKDSGDRKPELPGFDVVVMAQNVTNSSIQDGDLIALTTIEFVIAPTYHYQGDVKKILKDASWGRLVTVDDVKMTTVPYVKAGEGVELRFKGFNLKDPLAAYDGQDHTLWPWALRVNVHVLNREMNRVALGQAVLRIIPGDNRL